MKLFTFFLLFLLVPLLATAENGIKKKRRTTVENPLLQESLNIAWQPSKKIIKAGGAPKPIAPTVIQAKAIAPPPILEGIKAKDSEQYRHCQNFLAEVKTGHYPLLENRIKSTVATLSQQPPEHYVIQFSVLFNTTPAKLERYLMWANENIDLHNTWVTCRNQEAGKTIALAYGVYPFVKIARPASRLLKKQLNQSVEHFIRPISSINASNAYSKH